MQSDDPLPPSGKSYLTVLSSLPEFAAGGGKETLLFSTDEAWEISFVVENGVAGDWFAVAPQSGDAGEKIAVAVTLAANEDYAPRTFTLILNTAAQEKRILITQRQKNAILLDDRTRYEVTCEEQTFTVEVRANVEYRVKIAEGAEWIAEAPQARGLTEHAHTFRIAENPLSKERTGRIVFEDTASHLCDELTVVQAPREDSAPERSALKAFYEAAGGAGWTRSDNWDSDKPLGEWYGVETDDKGHVVALRLPKNNLSGTISEKIADLKFLRDLDLSRNDLVGELTVIEGQDVRSDLDGLTALETIDLSHNRITGQQMPAKWGALERLRVINLSSNLLQGDAFPPAWDVFFTNGRTVDLILNDNNLAGRIPTSLLQHPEWDRLAMQLIRQKAGEHY